MKTLRNLSNYTPAVLLIIFCALSFGLYAAPAAVDAFFKESIFTVYSLTKAENMAPIQTSNLAGGLILILVLGIEIAVLCIILNSVKILKKRIHISIFNLSSADFATFAIEFFYLAAFILHRVLWAEIAKFDGGLGFIKEGAGTIALSVFAWLFFAMTAVALIVKLVIERKLPDLVEATEKNTAEQNYKIMLISGFFVNNALFMTLLGISALPYAVTPFETTGGNSYSIPYGFQFSYDITLIASATVMLYVIIGSIYVIIKLLKKKFNFSKMRRNASLGIGPLFIVIGIINIYEILSADTDYTVGSGLITMIVFGAFFLMCGITYLITENRYYKKHMGELIGFQKPQKMKFGKK